MSDNARQEILELLAKQKITAREAADMLRQLDVSATAETPPKGMETDEADEPVYKAAAEEPAPVMTKARMVSTDDDIISSAEGKPRWLKIRVRDMESGRSKVTVNLPMWLVTFGLGTARRFGPDMGDVDLEMLNDMLKNGQRGILVDVQDEEDGEHVQIYLD